MTNLNNIRSYYEDRITRFGATPHGVDWNSEESQFRRFSALESVLLSGMITSTDSQRDVGLITDLGCGYGAFANYLSSQGYKFTYLGIDVVPQMLEYAKAHVPRDIKTDFATGTLLSRTCDYAIASGIFSVRNDEDNTEWRQHILRTVTNMYANTTRGIAFNCLSLYSDPDKRSEHLYYADPSDILHFCLDNLSSNVVCLHNYGLWEFTILVWRNNA